jgi:DNA-directed RNA polymerase specialized sigma24 family protein
MTGAQPAGLPGREADSLAASAVKAMQADGRHAEARERYAELVARHQRRAARIAFHYLRDSAESDEAVQDALVKAYSHLSSFREELPFEVWFTRILINGCLDRIKARTRRERWLVPMPESPHASRAAARRPRIRCSAASAVRNWRQRWRGCQSASDRCS